MKKTIRLVLCIFIFLLFLPGNWTLANAARLPLPGEEPSSHIISDGQFVDGPNLNGFNLSDYLNSSAPHLFSYADKMSEQAEYYSISPKVYLTLIEMTTHLLSNRNATQDEIDNPLDLAEKGFSNQVDKISQVMFDAYYLHLNTYSALPADKRSLPDFPLKDGKTYNPSADVNAGTYAVIAALAQLRDSLTIQPALDKTNSGSFYQTYLTLFSGDDPLDESNHISYPGDNTLTPQTAPLGIFQLPFLIGQSWQFDGVHSWAGTTGTDMSSIDFSPGWPSFGLDTSQDWVVAVAAGTPVKISACWFKIIHADGWETHYYHIEGIINHASIIGPNEKIGIIANTQAEATCSGGSANASHVHFGLKHNGAWTAIGGTTLSGWLVHPGRYAYDYSKDYMWLERDGVKHYTYQWLLNDGRVSIGSAVLNSPAGTIDSFKPAYTWSQVADATRYYLYVYNSSSTPISQWYVNGQNGLTCVGGTCTVTPDVELGGGSFSWMVRAGNDSGVMGPWSDVLTFTTPPAPSSVTVMNSPITSSTTFKPEYSWNEPGGAQVTKYYLYVYNSVGAVISQWYTVGQGGLVCSSGTCTITPDVELQGGSYSWMVRAGNPSGMSASWSSIQSFSTPPAPNSVITLNVPSSTISTWTPQYSWNAPASGGGYGPATRYYLYVYSGSNIAISQWFTEADGLSCSKNAPYTCTLTPNVILGVGTYSWMVRAGNPTGMSANWSGIVTFTTPSNIPGQALLQSPSGNDVNQKPTYTWNEPGGPAKATKYYLYVYSSTGATISQWYTVEQGGLVCNSGTCTITPDVALGTGSYSWMVRSSNVNGMGPWSAEAQLTVPKSLDTPPILLSPAGIIQNPKPTYSWNVMAQATEYQLQIDSASGTLLKQWYSSSDTCPSGSQICSITPDITLQEGISYTFKLMARNAVGSTPWSDVTSYQLLYPPSSKATLTFPKDTIHIAQPADFTWVPVKYVSWYKLLIESTNGIVFNTWYQASTICTDSTCDVKPALTLPNGNYQWSVLTWNEAGYGPWSDSLKFTTITTAEPLSPSGSLTTARPTFTWNGLSGATWYKLSVDNSTGNIFSKWYETSGICQDISCSISSEIDLADGTYTWKILSWGPTDYLGWSSAKSFDVNTTPILSSPKGDIHDNQPTYTWNAIPGMTSYKLTVTGSFGDVINQWFETKNICTDTTCSIKVDVTLQNDSYTWKVIPWNESGYGHWSKTEDFKVLP